MDRQLAERMVGAAVLLAALVIIVPSIFEADRAPPALPDPAEADGSLDIRTHTIHLDGAERAPPVPKPLDVPVSAPTPVVQGDGTAAARAPDTGSAGAGPDNGPTTAPPTVEPAHPNPPVATPSPPKAAPTRAPAAAAPDGLAGSSGGWVVQLGSFSRRENAARLAADLGKKGFPASMVSGPGQGGAVFRVRAGPVSTREEAVSLAARLTAAGYKGQVARQ